MRNRQRRWAKARRTIHRLAAQMPSVHADNRLCELAAHYSKTIRVPGYAGRGLAKVHIEPWRD